MRFVYIFVAFATGSAVLVSLTVNDSQGGHSASFDAFLATLMILITFGYMFAELIEKIGEANKKD